MLKEPSTRTYEDAVTALYSLQSNQSIIDAWTKERKTDKERSSQLLMNEMLAFAKSVDIDLTQQSVIHVAGTKGKGSTCAITESIIRNQGFSTGLFTSPHLISPRERIKLNGELISKELFTKYFWYCWDALKANHSELPAYFKFLTLLALRIFQEEKIECTILEVGIGGRVDSTNIFPKPIVTGISSLGFDHMTVLGNTLPEIASEKAGIIKTGVPIFTVNQKPDALKVIEDTAQEKKSPLTIVPGFNQYSFQGKLSLEGEHQKENASLAIALANCWLINQKKHPGESIYKNSNWKKYSYRDNNYSSSYFTPLPDSFTKGLKECNWPGRAQHFTSPEYQGLDFYLDGAHTPESSYVCLEWWKSVTKQHDSRSTIYIFVYNSTGGRNPEPFLVNFTDALNSKSIPQFDHIMIPLIATERPIDKNSKQLGKLGESSETWEDYVKNVYLDLNKNGSEEKDKITIHKSVQDCVDKIIEIHKQEQDGEKRNIKVLCTGSLYLIGSIIKSMLKDKAIF
eukprot:gene6057-7544_t